MRKLVIAFLGAAMLLAPSAASAATLSLLNFPSSDYSSIALPGNFDVGDMVLPYGLPNPLQVISAGNKGTDNGLQVSAATQVMYTYLGKEAGNTNALNFAVGTSGVGASIFSTASATAGITNSGWLNVGAGLLEFVLTSIDTTHTVFNNAEASSQMNIAYYFIDALHYYVFLDDYGGGDADYDDIGILVSIAAVPLPAGLPLFASGLALLGWLGMRRRRQSTAAVA